MSGKNPIPTRDSLIYEGVNVLVPLGGWQFVRAKRDPTTADKKFPVGALWLNTASTNLWIQTAGGGTWTQIDMTGGGGVVPVANGGTGVATLTSHGVVIGEGTSPVATTAAGTTGQVLTATTGADPSFQNIGSNSGLTVHGVLLAENNSAFAATAAGTSGQVFTSGGASADGAYQTIGVNSGLTVHGVLLAENNSAFVATAAGAVGTVLAGNGAADPTFQAIPSLNVVDTTGTTQAMAVNTTYIADNAAQVVFTLPATAAQGTRMSIIGNGAGGWQIAQNANQVIKSNGSTTTTGTGGTLSSTNHFNTIEILATVGGASTTWVVVDGNGTYTFV